jgi:hypothetical protein
MFPSFFQFEDAFWENESPENNNENKRINILYCFTKQLILRSDSLIA